MTAPMIFQFRLGPDLDQRFQPFFIESSVPEMTLVREFRSSVAELPHELHPENIGNGADVFRVPGYGPVTSNIAKTVADKIKDLSGIELTNGEFDVSDPANEWGYVDIERFADYIVWLCSKRGKLQARRVELPLISTFHFGQGLMEYTP